jgi:hypothetical protein
LEICGFLGDSCDSSTPVGGSGAGWLASDRNLFGRWACRHWGTEGRGRGGTKARRHGGMKARGNGASVYHLTKVWLIASIDGFFLGRVVGWSGWGMRWGAKMEKRVTRGLLSMCSLVFRVIGEAWVRIPEPYQANGDRPRW